MPMWFLRGLRRGVMTTRYPDRPDPSAATLPTPPLFRPCTLSAEHADLLADICPSRALYRDGNMLVYDVGACTACGRCLDAAQDDAAQGTGPDAVVPSGEFELAASNRSHLVKRIPLREES
jgi:ferredoxin